MKRKSKPKAKNVELLLKRFLKKIEQYGNLTGQRIWTRMTAC